MVDFTGGCPESYSLERSKVPEKLFSIMVKSYERKSMMCCSITSDHYKCETKTPIGLVMGHAYTVTKVRRVLILISPILKIILSL
jgi:calpain